MNSTVQLFRRLYENLPPLFPEETADKMKHALAHLEGDPSVTVEDVEKTMVVFGYEVWPYHEAYKEFLAMAEGKVGEHFLLPRLSLEMQERYREFIVYGGTWRDLHSGRPAEFFSKGDLSELCIALVDTMCDLRAYTDREVLGMERKKYLTRVAEFQRIIGDIKNKIGEMNSLADREQDHPQLANEIRERVKMFELGLCQLAPSCDFGAVCQSVDFFQGRKQELNRLRGLDKGLEIDFYSHN